MAQSILIIDKSMDPYALTGVEHDISETASLLKENRYRVDLVWSLKQYKFEDFEYLKRLCFDAVDERVRKHDPLVRDAVKSIYSADLYNFLRNTPINSIDDLSAYDLIVARPTCDDRRFLSKFMGKYSDIPIIYLSDHSLNDGISALVGSQKETISNVFRDDEGAYIINTCSLPDSLIDLIEYLIPSQTS